MDRILPRKAGFLAASSQMKDNALKAILLRVIGDFRTPGIALRLQVFLLAICFILLIIPMRKNVTYFYLGTQDCMALAIGSFIIYKILIKITPRYKPIIFQARLFLLIAALLGVLAFVGHWLILRGHDLSRDEQMASFDAEVFASGRLFAPLPELWHGSANVLNSLFMLEVPGGQGWISSYLPVNSAFRALFGTVLGTPWLTGPVFLVLGLAALWGCARRIWPEQRENAVIAVLLYAASSQVLITAMSSYAMTAHLALNLVWLWLFLRRSWLADWGCLVVAFLATGLHQPLPHPLFALPILFLVVLERNWIRAAFFLIGYGIIGAVWFAWPEFVAGLAGGATNSDLANGPNGFIARLIDTVMHGSPNPFQLMIANMLRFFAWQPLVLAPLLVIGMVLARRNKLAMALTGGIVLTIVVMLALLPYQGHGFGYRYLHGLIGNAILVAVFGFAALGETQAAWRALMVRTLIAGSLILTPMQMWMSYRNYDAYADVSEAIGKRDVDYFIVGIWDAPFSIDLVYNPPNLDQRPVRLFADSLKPDMIEKLCRERPTVGLSDEWLLVPIRAFSNSASKPLGARNAKLGERLSEAGCRVLQR